MPPGNKASHGGRDDDETGASDEKGYRRFHQKNAVLPKTFFVSHLRSVRHDHHVYKAQLTKSATIGKGGFGFVYKMEIRIKHHPQAGLVAVKCPFNTTRDKVERDILASLTDHANVVNLYYYFYRRGIVNLVMEYVDSGDLFSFIKEKYKASADGLGSYVDIFAFQMYRGLAFCHSKCIVHRDLKPENLLVNAHTGLLKIADFGCATYLADPKMDHINYVGTRDFRAPELIFGATRYTEKIDVWASAVVMTEMLLGVSIFYGASTTREQGTAIMEYLGSPSPGDCIDMNIKDREWPYVPKRRSLKAAFTDSSRNRFVINFMHHTLVYKPSRRLSAWELCAHPYFEAIHRKDALLPNGNPPVDLFDFSNYEMDSMPPTVRYLLKQLKE